MNIKIFSNFDEALTYHNLISETDRETVRTYLYNKWSIPRIIGDIDILTDTSLLFLLIVNTLETLGRSNNTSCKIALDYLKYLSNNNKRYFENLGIEDCEPYLHESQYVGMVPAISYCILNKHFKDLADSEVNPSIKINRAFWQAMYLVVQAIYHKEKRFAGTWYQIVVGFFDNFILEYSLTTYIEGLTFFNRGVRHDMLCPVSGTRDPDFYYQVADGIIVPAEFKKATKTVEALARYSYNDPDYIYKAKVLFTYGLTDAGAFGFYKIDYTSSIYTIEPVKVDSKLIEIVKAVGDKNK